MVEPVKGKATKAHEKTSTEEINKMIQARADEKGIDATPFLLPTSAKSPVKPAVPTPLTDTQMAEWGRRTKENEASRDAGIAEYLKNNPGTNINDYFKDTEYRKALEESYPIAEELMDLIRKGE